MPNLYTYRLATDTGIAPHISDGILTLTLCKPAIRKGAKVGDYVLALVAKGLRTPTQKRENIATGYKFRAAYLFRVDQVIQMESYMAWCSVHAKDKLCREPAFFGDCQYNASLTYLNGPHGEDQRTRNISGKNALISRHYAAWTATNAFVLSPEQMTSMGISIEQAERVTQGQFKTPLTEAHVAAIDSLIESGPKPYASANAIAMGAAEGQRGGTRRRRRTRKS